MRHREGGRQPARPLSKVPSKRLSPRTKVIFSDSKSCRGVRRKFQLPWTPRGSSHGSDNDARRSRNDQAGFWRSYIFRHGLGLPPLLIHRLDRVIYHNVAAVLVVQSTMQLWIELSTAAQISDLLGELRPRKKNGRKITSFLISKIQFLS